VKVQSNSEIMDGMRFSDVFEAASVVKVRLSLGVKNE